MNTRTGNHKPRLLLVVLAFASLMLGVSSANAGTQSTAPRHQGRYETWLTKEVHHQLAMLPWYGVFDNLEYQVDGSQVTLMGQVVRPITKSDAEASVKHLEGVTRVVNRITVLPDSPFDNQIRRAEYRAIFSEASLSRYAMGPVPSIHIIVDNGHVTLEGVVDSQADRNVASLRANAVPDVFSVTNHLRVA